MKTSNHLILSTSPLSQPARKPRVTANLTRHHRFLYRGKRRNPTGKERDSETGLYYYGARYLDSRTGRWLSGDPAMGEYVPSAPVNDEARKRNGNLPGQGGVFNYVNLHVYHYAGNNPVRYTDPDGRISEEEQAALMQAKIEKDAKSTTFGPDPDSLFQTTNIDKLKSAANANLGQPYGDGNQCDDWLEKVLDQGGIDPSNYLGGRASSTTVQEHIDATVTGGNASPTPGSGVDVSLPEGVYVVFMNEGKKSTNTPHAGLLFVNKNKSVAFFQSSSSLRNKQSAKEEYTSVNAFQNNYGYNKFYYQQVRR